jgi:DNA-binding NtrC family response regulator
MTALIIVDDDEETALLYSRILQKTFSETILCKSVDEFFATYDGNLRAVVIADYVLGHVETADSIIEEIENNRWPISVILISGDPLANSKVPLNNCISSFLLKPISIVALDECARQAKSGLEARYNNSASAKE